MCLAENRPWQVWIDHTLYFAGEEGATMIGDTQTALTEAYVKVFPREYLLDVRTL